MKTKMFTLLDNAKSIDIETPYKYGDTYVPRVTTILSEMLHEDYLMNWANNVGLYQHKKHTDYTDKACTIGELSHKGFEIVTRERITDIRLFPFNILNMPREYYESVHNCIEAYINWYKQLLENHTVEVLMQETPLICKYYGGTVDCVLKIDGEIYIIDYKTSNHLSYKYHLQLAAYKIILEMIYNLHVDGSIVLSLNKTRVVFYEQYMNFTHIQQHALYMNQLTETFLSLVYAYYNRKAIESMYQQYVLELEGGKTCTKN